MPRFLLPAQDELKLAIKQGNTLLSCIKDQASKTESHILNPDEVENQTTAERFVKTQKVTQLILRLYSLSRIPADKRMLVMRTFRFIVL